MPVSTAYHPAPVLAETHRNLYDGISQDELALAGDHGSAHAGGAGAELRLCQRPAVAGQAARRGAVVRPRRADECIASRHGDATMRNISPAYVRTRNRGRSARSRTRDASICAKIAARVESRARPQVSVPRPANALRSLFPACRRQCGIELPQAFFMRVAMGLAIREIDREARAIEFYQSAFVVRLHGSTPTLFNSGTPRPQLSVVLPDHGCGRSRWHFQIDQGQRPVRQILRRPRQRLDAGARPRRAHQGHQRRKSRASCRS